MRVLYCTDTYPPQINGVSMVTELSVDGLRRRDVDVAVIAPKYPAQVTTAVGSPEVRLALPSVACPGYPDIRIAALAPRRIAEVLDEFRPDLVHCTTEFVIGLLGGRAARARGIPVVTSYHTDFGRYAAAYGVPWLGGVVGRSLARVHAKSARVYTPSAAAKGDLLKLGVDRVEVWGRGVDTGRFSPERYSPALRERLGLHGFVFITVGRLAPEKGVDRIVAAFGAARDALGPGKISLLIVGEGPSRARLERQAPEGVHFAGWVDREALPDYYASADAFAYSSTTETLGLVVLEAMASGLPVIATPAGGVAEHLRDLENGLAYPPEDVDALTRAMLRLIQSPPLGWSLANGARATALALGWEEEVDRLKSSYQAVLQEASLPRGPSARGRAAILSATDRRHSLAAARSFE